MQVKSAFLSAMLFEPDRILTVHGVQEMRDRDLPAVPAGFQQLQLLPVRAGLKARVARSSRRGWS